MTVIAYRNGVLAADSQVSWDDLRFAQAVKLARSPRGHLAGAAGEALPCAMFLEWVRRGCRGRFKPPRDTARKDFEAVLISPDGEIRVIERDGSYPIDAPWFAGGSAAQLAFGAMAAGASAVEAVEIAKSFDMSCGGGTQVERI